MIQCAMWKILWIGTLQSEVNPVSELRSKALLVTLPHFSGVIIVPMQNRVEDDDFLEAAVRTNR